MERIAWKAVLGLISGITVLLAACGGGGGNNSGGGGGSQPTTPTVTVTPATSSISVAQSLAVTVSVSGTSGTPTGSVILKGGSYTSSAATLTNGSATITIPAGALATGSLTFTSTYSPDSASSSKYNSASGTALVSITLATPTLTVTPASTSIGTGQSLSVAVTVAGFTGGAVPTGTVTIATGSYTSAAANLASGGATIIIPGGTLVAGNATLTASYSPDSASSAIYAGASGSAAITVTAKITPTIAVTPALQSLSTSQSLSVAIKVTDPSGSATPTGSIVLSSGTYQSASTTLSNGGATISIPAYSLVYGSNPLSAAYTPDTGSAGSYNSATGTATVSVAKATPTVTVTPASTSINTAQSLDVTVSVAGPGTGAPAPTGTVSLSGGGYTSSSPVTLSNGSANITIAAGALSAGNVTLTASYTPDTASSAYFSATTGNSAAVTVITMSTITVSQSDAIAPVTEQLLGMNLATWYNVPANATGINKAFTAAGIKVVRWPGGSWSDMYHWGDGGTQPSKCPDPTDPTHSTWGGWATFPQFISSIVQAGSFDLALTANYGSNTACNAGGDPQEAADWAAEAVILGYPASHITVGNENYGSWEYDLHANKHDPTTYANAVIGANGYYQLIKKASPNTEVGIVVDANCTTASGCTNGWDSTVLSGAKGSYDFVEYHYYPQYTTVTSDTYLVHQAALDFSTNIATVKSELAAAGETGTPIYVGEIGGNSSNPGTQSWSITQGLYAGQLLGEAMNDGIARLTWWIGFGNCLGAGNNSPLLYGWQDTWGALSIFADGDPNCPGAGSIGTMSPTAQAFNLFQNIAVSGENALKTAVNGDTNNIRAYSATHSGGTALFLFNLNQNQSMPVTITLSKQSASNSVTVITYDKKIYDYTNPTCKTDAGCTYDPAHDYTSAVWAPPATNVLGQQSLPLTLNLTPWSMNVVVIQ